MRIALILFLLLCGQAATAEVAAKRLFGAADEPSAQAPVPHGSYAKGCLAGGAELAITGPGWQAMRLGRNRNWGHPELVAFVARLGDAAQAAGWPGLLVGDLSQPRGGPMLSGHRSHQIGLDADIWMRPGEARVLSYEERRDLSSFSVVAPDRINVSAVWTPAHAKVIRAAAVDPKVARIFVNAAIKRELCASTAGDRSWLRKVRPWWGHDHHFHVRLSCPAGAEGCAACGGWVRRDAGLVVQRRGAEPKAKPGQAQTQRTGDG